jgi:hypothetical protein
MRYRPPHKPSEKKFQFECQPGRKPSRISSGSANSSQTLSPEWPQERGKRLHQTTRSQEPNMWALMMPGILPPHVTQDYLEQVRQVSQTFSLKTP